MYNNENELENIENFILHSEEILNELRQKSSEIKAKLSIKTLKNNLKIYVGKFAC